LKGAIEDEASPALCKARKDSRVLPEKAIDDRPYAEIAVELPLESTFTYSIPDNPRAKRFQASALVPWQRTATGRILATSSAALPEVKTKPIIDILDETPIFDKKRLSSTGSLRTIRPLLGTPLIHPEGEHKELQALHCRPRGRKLLAALDGEILAAASKEISLSTLLKKFPLRPVHSTLGRLKRDGLIEEKIVLKGGGTRKTERVFKAAGPPVDPETLKRSPIQAKVYKRVLEGTVTMTELRKALGEVSGAVKKLVEKNLVSETEQEVGRNPFSDITPKAADFAPNAEQQAVIDAITAIGTRPSPALHRLRAWRDAVPEDPKKS
jgi:primosomal protein N'